VLPGCQRLYNGRVGYNPISTLKGGSCYSPGKILLTIQGWLRQAEKSLCNPNLLTMTFKATNPGHRCGDSHREHDHRKIRQKFPAHQVLTEEQGVPGERTTTLGTRPRGRNKILPARSADLGRLAWTPPPPSLPGQPVAGFFYVPALKEMFWGSELAPS